MRPVKSKVAPTDMMESVAPHEIQWIEPQYMAAIVAPHTTNKLAINKRRKEVAARVASSSRVTKQHSIPRACTAANDQKRTS